MAKYLIVVLLVCGAGYGGYVVALRYRKASVPAAPAKHVIHSGPRLTDYKLTDQHGQTFDSHDLNGHVTLTSFFFTSCPAICTRMNRSLAGLAQQNDDAALRLVSISCDPAHDSPQVLNQYAEQLGADDRWAFLTGDVGYIERIGKDLFGLKVGKQEHSDLVIVSDRTGKLRGSFKVTDAAQLEKLQALLQELRAE